MSTPADLVAVPDLSTSCYFLYYIDTTGQVRIIKGPAFTSPENTNPTYAASWKLQYTGTGQDNSFALGPPSVSKLAVVDWKSSAGAFEVRCTDCAARLTDSNSLCLDSCILRQPNGFHQ